MKKFFLLLILVGSFLNLNAQVKDYELGAYDIRYRNPQGGNYDYSDPEALNIKVSVWGFVKYPGRYTVPIYTTMSDLLSFAGGPTDDSNLDDLRVYRLDEEGNQNLIKFNYDDLLWGENLESDKIFVPKLKASDILIVPGEPRLYFRDKLSIWLSVISALTSLTILVLNIVK